MQVDITVLVTETETWDLTGSKMTHGDNVAKNTWANAKKQAGETPLLDTPEKLEAMRQWARESGGWEREEIAAWDDNELNALFLQLVTQDMREAGLEDCDQEDFDWEEYATEAGKGRISGNLFKGVDGKFYYQLS